MAKKQKSVPQWRDRIVGFERIPARDLQGHEGNWRLHPQAQRDALSGLLREVGIVDALLVYDSAAHGGRTILDGHLRHSLDAMHPWPCLVLDVDDAEAALLLATFDPLTSMAEANQAQLRGLLDTVQTGEAGLQAMLSQLAEQYGLVPPTSPEAPEAFPEYGEDIATDYCCPKCGYEWSGKPA